MGLLVGETIPIDGRGSIAHVAGVHILTRSDKKPDRCEISPTQLAGASAEADRLAQTTGRNIRIIGWYHSHPHITVLPSHVDVRTQGTWQMMDDSFVGLIFSVFNEEANKTQRIQTIAFQSTRIPNSEMFTQKDIPLDVVQHGWPQTLLGVRSPQTLSSLARVLFEEEKTMVSQAAAKSESTLQTMYNLSIHNKFLAKFLEYMILPIRQHFANTQESCQRRLESIQAQKQSLSEQLVRVKQALAEKEHEKQERERQEQEEAQHIQAAASTDDTGAAAMGEATSSVEENTSELSAPAEGRLTPPPTNQTVASTTTEPASNAPPEPGPTNEIVDSSQEATQSTVNEDMFGEPVQPTVNEDMLEGVAETPSKLSPSGEPA